MTVRLARPDDTAAVHAIYAPEVRDGVASFELDPPAPDELRRRIETTLARRPWLVSEHDGTVTGYAYATPYRSRPAYQWSIEVSVYVATAAHRTGVGRGLYTPLLALLTAQGFANAYAGVTLPNPASAGLHESLGFTPIGVFRAAGFKFGVWHDVGWWQRPLAAPALPPPPPCPRPRRPPSPTSPPT